MNFEGTMEMAALGRPFFLGMLYNCRTDKLVPGLTLWDHDDLMKNIRQRPENYSEFIVVASESIEDKSSALNVKGSLKASVLFGMVEVEGSAKYLNDQKTSKNQARVTVRYKATTNIQTLSMNHLGSENVKHPYIIDKGIATHVVTAILYGAQAFFVFDRDVSEEENHVVIEGNLRATMEKISNLAVEGNASLTVKDQVKANEVKLSCKFHGDFSLPRVPSSFQEAFQVYQSLPTLLGPNREKVVPVKVWLLPLTDLDSSPAKIFRQISAGLVQEAQSVLEELSELDMRCNDAMKTTTAQQFPQIGKKLKSFKEMCNVFKLDFQRSLSEKLPSIRGGGEEESVLAEVLIKRNSSPFSSKNLNEWMDCKENEISILQSFTKILKNTKIISSQSKLHGEILSAENTVCLIFTSLGSVEPYLSALSNYNNKTSKLQDPLTYDVEKEQWYQTAGVLDTTMKNVKLVSDFAEANKENKNLKFLTMALTNENLKGSSIYLYKDGSPEGKNFEPPSRPEIVRVRKPSLNSVTLKISPPRSGAEDITSYSVEHCVSGEDGWKQTTAPKGEEVTVKDLRQCTEYVFRCRAITSLGVGPLTELRTEIRVTYTFRNPYKNLNPFKPGP